MPKKDSEHTLVIKYTKGWQQMHINCHAHEQAMCHAVFDCACEEYFNLRIIDGHPVHDHSVLDDDDNEQVEQHIGEFEDDECNLKDFFDNTDEPVEKGCIEVPVEAVWEGEYYSFHIPTEEEED